MKPYDLMASKDGTSLVRILEIQKDRVLLIDCLNRSMPSYVEPAAMTKYRPATEAFLYEKTGYRPVEMEKLAPVLRKKALDRYTVIAPVLSVLSDAKDRKQMIGKAAEENRVSKQTVRNYLRKFLIYQEIGALSPKEATPKEELTADQKTMRWSLNKFFYTQHKNSLKTAYTMMLRARYTDAFGQLQPHPTFYQFRYFYRKTRKTERFLISRNGIKNYQRNSRPLLGDGVQEFAPQIGTAFLDGTTCDIYLVDEAGQLVGRPILVVAADANTSLCMGYALLWEGGTYSLQNLMLNILTDKVELCRRMGIQIKPEQWPVNQLPGVMVSDKGTEYVGQTFGQIVELGVTLIELPSFRPELKGTVEKLFDLVQSAYKNVLKGRGVIMPDYQERGAHDYRKDAVLTIGEFERILVRCLVYYNSERVLESYPYTEEMIENRIKPHASDIWNWKLRKPGVNLISVTERELALTLLPRTVGSFTRVGLKVNHLRYHAEGCKEQYLKGGQCTVAFNPDNSSKVWVKEKNGSFKEFHLIESRFQNMSVDQVNSLQARQRDIVRDAMEENYQAQVELMNFIEAASAGKDRSVASLKDIRQARARAIKENHRDLGEVIDA